MTAFIHDDFLLRTAAARRLYHEHAAGLLIVDYHNHLDPLALAEDRAFANLTRLWIATDPYKHRAMRIAGVPERLITGDASDREKFEAWAATVPLTIGNPLFHWTALELQRYFGINEVLSPETAGRIWEQCNEQLRTKTFTARQLIARANVEVLCTSDRLNDDLSAHARLAQSDFKTRVFPSPRDAEAPDTKRLDEFQRLGCRLADHAVNSFDSDALRACAREYARRGWILQLHFGAQRETSTRLRRLAGPAGGYATIGSACDIAGLCRFLDGLEQEGCLPRTILYPLNPADYAAIATLTGSFAADGVRGKVQFGPAWWYNDHALGIRQHLEVLAHYGLLATFIGMTTDSRSLLSMVRHEYFRRVLCTWLGERVEAGELPADLGALVRAVCYENAREWILKGRTEK
jgi:glucuronate isomerase